MKNKKNFQIPGADQLSLQDKYAIRQQIAQGAASADTIQRALRPGHKIRKSQVSEYLAQMREARESCDREGPLQRARFELTVKEQDMIVELRQFLDAIDPGDNPVVIRAVYDLGDKLSEASQFLGDKNYQDAGESFEEILAAVEDDLPKIGGPTVDASAMRTKVDELFPRIDDE